MELTQTEIIQILRKRAGLNQAELGSRAFDTNPDSGRTKIKNIELGKQTPTDEDLERIALCLDVPVETLRPSSVSITTNSRVLADGVLISPKILNMFPDLADYLEMLEKATRIDDVDLIKYISHKISDTLREGPRFDEKSKTTRTSMALRKDRS
jgi:transcriptional regulator with XRE-family HTH domain